LEIYNDGDPDPVADYHFGDMSHSNKKQFSLGAGKTGNIVKIRLTDTNWLQLAEVQVFA